MERRGVFGAFAQYYFDKNIPVVPITPNKKFPNIPNWQNTDFEPLIDKFINYGIGFIPKDAGLVALDIDVEDEETKNKIKAILPPIYCGRIGNKKRLPTIFFKYRDGIERIDKHPVELIVDGKQCVLPPTMHPDCNYRYEWVGQTDLLNADFDLIPEYDQELIDDILKIVGQTRSFNSPDVYSRNKKLYDLCCACIGRGEDATTTINELINYDKENHSSPWFEDTSESQNTDNAYVNAVNFYGTTFKNLSKKTDVPSPTKLEIDLTVREPKKVERIRLPKHRGILGELFDHIYKVSDIPRSRLSWGSALITVGTILANRVVFGDVYTNIYGLLVLDSGGGKDVPLKSPHDILREAGYIDRVGETDIVSDNSFLMNLEKKKNKLLELDEAGDLFSTTTSSNHFTARAGKVLTTLYTRPGKYYGGKVAHKFISRDNQEGVVGECFSPCVSIIGATTFNDIQNHLTGDAIRKGLGGRFLYFTDNKRKYASFKRKKKETINPELIKKLQKLAKTYPGGFLNIDDPQPLELEITDKAWDRMLEINEEVKKLINESSGTNNEPVANRFMVNMAKMMIIDHCSINHDSIRPISKDSVEWAYCACTAIFEMASSLFDTNVSENQYHKMKNSIINALEKHDGVLTRTEMCRKINIPARIRDEILRTLLESEEISQTKDGKKITYVLIK